MTMVHPTGTALTAYQRDIWIPAAFAPDSPQFNCVVHERLEGAVDLDVLQACVERAFRRADSLRMRLDDEQGTPYQWVSQLALDVARVDLSGEPNPAAACAAWVQRSMERPFTLRGAALAEAALVLESPEIVHLCVKAHHIVADAWACNELSLQIFDDYARAIRGQQPLPVDNAPSYLAFTAEERGYRKSAQYGSDREFYRTALADAVPALFPRKATGSRGGARHTLLLEGDLMECIRAAGLPKFSYLVTLLGGYLAHVLHTEEIILGVPLMNRTDADRVTIGQFANPLPLRIRPLDGRTVREVVTDVQRDIRLLQRHTRLSLGDILRELPTAAGPRQLFDVTLSQMRFARPAAIPGIHRETTMRSPVHDQEALNIYLSDFDDVADVHADLVHALDVFDEDFPIAAAAGQLKTMIISALDLVDEPLRAVPLLTPAQRAVLVDCGRGPDVPLASEATLHGLFETQAQRHPERTAVVDAATGASLTYAELDTRANRLARALRAQGVGPDDRVAVLLERGPDLLVALLGVLKAGGAYVPVDPGYPAERIRFMLADSQSKIVLVNSAAVKMGAAGIPVRELAELVNTQPSGAAVEPLATSRDLAYVIYTSGSTGKPKGAMIEHRSVVNRLAWMQRAYPLGPDDTLVQKTPASFDVSVWELFWWAVEGARLALLPVGGEKDPKEILRVIRDQQVNVIHFVPSMLGPFLDLLQDSPSLVEDTRSLRYVFASGEALPAARVEQFNRVLRGSATPRLVNLYGPTEATVDVSFYDCPAEENVGRVPIGRPVDNTQLYVLDAHHQPQPAGAPASCTSGECRSPAAIWGGQNSPASGSSMTPSPREGACTAPATSHDGSPTAISNSSGAWTPR
jgi:amino acid adenylation domain-containing protein